MLNIIFIVKKTFAARIGKSILLICILGVLVEAFAALVIVCDDDYVIHNCLLIRNFSFPFHIKKTTKSKL